MVPGQEENGDDLGTFYLLHRNGMLSVLIIITSMKLF